MKSLILFGLISIFSESTYATGTVLVNGKNIKTKEDLHTLLAKGLNFPKVYGNSLDSLSGILLTDNSAETVIKFKHLNVLRTRLGAEYVQSLMEVIGEASNENSRVVLLLE